MNSKNIFGKLQNTKKYQYHEIMINFSFQFFSVDFMIFEISSRI